MHLIAFFLLRLFDGLVVIEVVQTQTAIRACRAMRISYAFPPYFFKLNTMQCVSPIIYSQRQLTEKNQRIYEDVRSFEFFFSNWCPHDDMQ